MCILNGWSYIYARFLYIRREFLFSPVFSPTTSQLSELEKARLNTVFMNYTQSVVVIYNIFYKMQCLLSLCIRYEPVRKLLRSLESCVKMILCVCVFVCQQNLEKSYSLHARLKGYYKAWRKRSTKRLKFLGLPRSFQ